MKKKTKRASKTRSPKKPKAKKSRAQIIIDTIKVSGEERLAICDIILRAKLDPGESKFISSTCLRLVKSGKLSRRKTNGLWTYKVTKKAA
jgi:predicted transcriptional regulator